MAFELFSPSRHHACFVTLTHAGALALSSGLVEQWGLADARYACLLFERETTRLGVRIPVAPTEPGASRVTVRGRLGRSLHTRPLLDREGIAYGVTRRYAWVWDAKVRLYLVDLRSPLP